AESPQTRGTEVPRQQFRRAPWIEPPVAAQGGAAGAFPFELIDDRARQRPFFEQRFAGREGGELLDRFFDRGEAADEEGAGRNVQKRRGALLARPGDRG